MNGVRGPRWFLVAALSVVAGFAALGSATPAPAAEGARVSMVDNEPDLTNWHFDPAEVTVPAGSTVVWVNTGKEEHTVTSDPASREKFDSGYKKRGTSFQRVFSRPGRFSYYCAPHPWMKGTVVVVEGAAPAPTSAAARGADSVSSATTAPAPAATSTTFQPSLAAPTTAPAAAAPAETGSTAPADTAPTSADDEDSEETTAAPVSSKKDSGGNLAGTLAVVLLPTLGGLALGARLRRSTSA
jgi:plastocyanin